MTQSANINQLVTKLDNEWLEDGFLYQLRECKFDDTGYIRFEGLLNTVKQLDDKSSPSIDRNLVRLLWFIPQFMEWQTERLIDRGNEPEKVHGANSNIREMIGAILGEP